MIVYYCLLIGLITSSTYVNSLPRSNALHNLQSLIHTKRLVKRWNPMKLWDMPISFKIDEDIPDTLRGKIRAAVELIESQTIGCVKFQETSLEDVPYIHYRKAEVVGKCSGESTVGKNNDFPNYINVNDRCVGAGKLEHVLLHETLHALGMEHEFCRPDRNKYVRIHKEMIKEDQVFNFDLREDFDTFDLPYDYNSVMHYASTSMAKFPGLITMDPILDVNYGSNLAKMNDAVRRTTMSDKDVSYLRNLYHC